MTEHNKAMQECINRLREHVANEKKAYENLLNILNDVMILAKDKK